MRLLRDLCGLTLATVVCATLTLSGCGGGGGGGDSAPAAASISQISVQGVGTPIWTAVNASPTPPPVCPTGVAVNSTIIFDFAGSVDAGSLPQTGTAIGSINITTVTSSGGNNITVPAVGAFSVVDDPTLPVGNRRRVTFTPTPPASPAAPCVAGMTSVSTYQISIPRGGTSQNVLVVNGQSIANEAITCFTTCDCPTSTASCPSFVDPVAGAPFVAFTSPSMGNPAPAAIDPCSVSGNTVTILFSEPLNPTGISLSNIKIVDAATGAQVPGAIQFFQAGSIPSLATQSRVDYIASSPLLGSRTYQLVVTSAVKDFGGNPVQLAAGNPTAQLFFATNPVTFAPHAPIVENFDTFANRTTATGELHWDGTGQLSTTFPLALTGDGSDPPLTPAANANLDTNSPTTRQGFFNYTNVNIPAGVTLRVVGPYRAHIRCTGNIVINGTLDAQGGTLQAPTPIGDPNQGPRAGAQNNGGGLTCVAKGGVGNAGAGDGGDGSPGACNARATSGENGYGPRLLTGASNTGTPGNAFYAGGPGGRGGCFPVVAGCTAGDIGGLGGAGGTAGTAGEDGRPRANSAICGTVSPVIPPVAIASAVPAIMVPPINTPSAGSGGGGGGDHLETTGTIPQTDDQGGGGGGGGGGIRISCVGSYTQGAGSLIRCSGVQGALGSTLSGAGGSGSGGEIWIQSFSTVTIAATATMNIDGPGRVGAGINQQGCSNQASGGGGKGLLQIEAASGPIPTGFLVVPATGGVISTPTFQYANGVNGDALSNFFYTGYGAPDFTSVVETFSVGNAPNAALQISYEGAFEAVNSTPQNRIFDSGTIKSTATGGGPILAASINELDGYPFIRFRVHVSYPAPPATPSNATLPSVNDITINYDTAPNCP